MTVLTNAQCCGVFTDQVSSVAMQVEMERAIVNASFRIGK